MPTMNEIQHEIGNLFSVLEDLDEEQVEEKMPALLAYADELAVQESRKVDGIAYALRREQAGVEFLKAEEARIRVRRQAKERALFRFKDHVRNVFQVNGLQKVKGESSTVFLRKSESVVVEGNPQDLPSEFVEQRIEYRPRKAEIKKALKNGTAIPGASLLERQSINFR